MALRNSVVDRLNLTSILSGYVPYTGATADVDLGAFDLYSNQVFTNYITGNPAVGGGIYPSSYQIQDASNVNAFDWNNRIFYDEYGNNVAEFGAGALYGFAVNSGLQVGNIFGFGSYVDFGSGGDTSILTNALVDTSNVTSVDPKNRYLINNSNGIVFDYQTNTLYDGAGTTVAFFGGGYGGYFVAPSLAADTILNASGGYGIEVSNRYLKSSLGATSYDWENNQVYDSVGGISADLSARYLYDSANAYSIDYNARAAFDASSTEVFSWGGTYILFSKDALPNTNNGFSLGGASNFWANVYATYFKASNGTAGAPAYTFGGATNQGMYSVSSNVLGFSVGGTVRFQVFAAGIEGSAQVRGLAVSAATPTFAPSNDTNTGVYFLGSDVMGLATGGVRALEISAAQKVAIKQGGTTNAYGVKTAFYTNHTAASNISTTETDLHTVTTAASSLNSNADSIEFEMSGQFAANANNKRIRIYWGGQVIFDTTSQAFNSGDWVIRGRIKRLSTTTYRSIVTWNSTNATAVTSPQRTAWTGNALTTNIFKTTGQGGASNDITLDDTCASWLPQT